mmetsp:Transcript_5120/g.12142  ORF Transcript_5120/g.12142 Transcript_5120/m.12142 type:complete len:275 (-) Transcript_5120:393-1217(-)
MFLTESGRRCPVLDRKEPVPNKVPVFVKRTIDKALQELRGGKLLVLRRRSLQIQVRQVTQESRSKRGTSHRREGPNEAAPVVGITSLDAQWYRHPLAGICEPSLATLVLLPADGALGDQISGRPLLRSCQLLLQFLKLVCGPVRLGQLPLEQAEGIARFTLSNSLADEALLQALQPSQCLQVLLPGLTSVWTNGTCVRGHAKQELRDLFQLFVPHLLCDFLGLCHPNLEHPGEVAKGPAECKSPKLLALATVLVKGLLLHPALRFVLHLAAAGS